MLCDFVWLVWLKIHLYSLIEHCVKIFFPKVLNSGNKGMI